MNTTSEGSRFKKLARLCGIASALLMAAWLLPPAIHSYRHLCPVRPDGVTEAGAVPSFARQTGMSCAMCHTVFPELTPMGRRFKLNGYTMTTKPADVSDYSIATDTNAAQRNLILSYVSPLSYGVQSAYSKFSRAPKDSNLQNGNPNNLPASAQAQGDTVQFPEQVSLYYNGRVSDNIGAWFQLTYAGNSGTIGIDNTEIRYANHSDDRKWVYGTFVNNTVGMQDVYNTQTSAFGVPLFNVPSLYNLGVGAGGLSGPITNNMFTNSAGIGEYAFFNDSLYAEISGYHSGVQGALTTDNKSINAGGLGAIDGMAPRARISYEQDWDQNSAEVGLVGMQSSFIPAFANATANSPVTANQYLNGGADWQFQHIGDDNIFTFLGSYTLQRASNNPLFVNNNYSNQIDNLHQLSMTGEYYYRRHYGGLINFVDTNGTKDALQYGADGSPHNQYWVFELDYMPWLNTRFVLQYDAYTVVNGNQSPFYQANGSSGVDGKASNNNTFVVGLWLDF
jgi:hypothetical protein